MMLDDMICPIVLPLMAGFETLHFNRIHDYECDIYGSKQDLLYVGSSVSFCLGSRIAHHLPRYLIDMYGYGN